LQGTACFFGVSATKTDQYWSVVTKKQTSFLTLTPGSSGRRRHETSTSTKKRRFPHSYFHPKTHYEKPTLISLNPVISTTKIWQLQMTIVMS